MQLKLEITLTNPIQTKEGNRKALSENQQQKMRKYSELLFGTPKCNSFPRINPNPEGSPCLQVQVKQNLNYPFKTKKKKAKNLQNCKEHKQECIRADNCKRRLQQSRLMTGLSTEHLAAIYTNCRHLYWCISYMSSIFFSMSHCFGHICQCTISIINL